MTGSVAELVAVAAGGFLSSAHCIGMCGGFAALVGVGRGSIAPLVARQGLYNLGRIFTYAFLGALAGAAGLFLSRWRVLGIAPAQALAWLAGLLMILLGLSTLGVLRYRGMPLGILGGAMARIFAGFLNARGNLGYFLAGMANGFLPCGLVYSFLALAAATGDGLGGSMVMVAFGLGTAPAMLVIGCGVRVATPALRRHVLRVAAVFVVALGGLTIYRGGITPGGDCCSEERAAPCHEHASALLPENGATAGAAMQDAAGASSAWSDPTGRPAAARLQDERTEPAGLRKLGE